MQVVEGLDSLRKFIDLNPVNLVSLDPGICSAPGDSPTFAASFSLSFSL